MHSRPLTGYWDAAAGPPCLLKLSGVQGEDSVSPDRTSLHSSGPRSPCHQACCDDDGQGARRTVGDQGLLISSALTQLIGKEVCSSLRVCLLNALWPTEQLSLSRLWRPCRVWARLPLTEQVQPLTDTNSHVSCPVPSFRSCPLCLGHLTFLLQAPRSKAPPLCLRDWLPGLRGPSCPCTAFLGTGGRSPGCCDVAAAIAVSPSGRQM